MAVGPAPGQLVEIDLGPGGTFVDVTKDCELLSQGPLTTHFGRTSPYAQPGPATLTVTLRNELGKYTPRRQVLADGFTPHPYWPNVKPRRRIRWSYTIAGTTYYRFTGYVKGWPPAVEASVRPIVTITATTRDDQLSRVTMRSPITTEILADGPVRFWSLTDGSADTPMNQTAVDLAGGDPLRVAARAQQALNFGDNGPGFGDGSGVRFSPGSASSGQYLYGSLAGLDLTAFTIAGWVNLGTALPAWMTGTQKGIILGLDRARDAAFAGSIGVIPNGRLYFKSGQSIQTSTSVIDGGWHFFAVTRATSGGACTLYLDGVNYGASLSSAAITDMDALTLGEAAILGQPFGPSRLQGNVGYIAVYDYALSSGRITGQYAAGSAYYGDTVDARIKRHLGIAGLTAGDWTIDASTVTVNHYPQAGKDVVSACQEMATTEGGGGVFYVLPNGRMRFANRRFRDSRTPVLTLDASIPALLDPSSYSPAFDETTLNNTTTVSRAAESGELSSQTYTDPASVAEYGVAAPGDVTTYTTSDQDALNLAQWQVAGGSQPRFRLDQVTVNMHASPVSLYAALAAVEIGSRIRVINLPPGTAPTSTVDLVVEGWAETVDNATYRVVFDTSPVEHRWQWDVSRWAPDPGVMTLNASITRTATTLAVATATGPTCTTTSGFYPATVRFGEEDIILNGPPGGSTSPQTWTGVTRGANGTLAAAQSAGAVMTVSPPDGWAL